MDSRKSIDPQHCANGCGFYGSTEYRNLCSSCYREEIKKASMEIEEPLNQKSSPPPSNATSRFFNSAPRSAFSFHSNNISGSNSFFGASSSNTKQFSFSAASSLTDKTCISHRANPNNFLFGSSTVRKDVCNTCNKRVGLTGFRCRCGNKFCGKHRYPEEHSCSFDYKAFARENMLKQNQVCKGDTDKLRNRI